MGLGAGERDLALPRLLKGTLALEERGLPVEPPHPQSCPKRSPLAGAADGRGPGPRGACVSGKCVPGTSPRRHENHEPPEGQEGGAGPALGGGACGGVTAPPRPSAGFLPQRAVSWPSPHPEAEVRASGSEVACECQVSIGRGPAWGQGGGARARGLPPRRGGP